MSTPSKMKVSVEAPCERQVQEIAYDGTEICKQPPTLPQTLVKCTERIDFSKTALDDSKREENLAAEEAKDTSQSQANVWPWDSVRNKLNDALTQVCVLSDVTSIAKNTNYLVLDPVPEEPEHTAPIVQVCSRKNAIAQAAQILLSGAERLRNLHSEHDRKAEDFHIDLLRLRQNWRIKKTYNAIIGDLSYRSAGSEFRMSGTFEVTRAVETADDNVASGSSTGGSNNALLNMSPQTSSALHVILPSELQGAAYIKVVTQKDQEDLFTACVNLKGHGPNIEQPVGWEKTLLYAQNVLFCKELFNQLAREAIQLQAPIPHVVTENEIRATLLPGIQLVISLCHSTIFDSSQPSTIEGHDAVLEHSLHQLLREIHHKNLNHEFPHPSSGPLGSSMERMYAGPLAADRYSLNKMYKTQTILEQIIAQAQHAFIRTRTNYVLETLAKDIKDPQIMLSWNNMNIPTMSSVRITFVTDLYNAASHPSLVIHVNERWLKCICRDGRVMELSYEPQELRDLILCQISLHRISSLLNLAQSMAWTVLSNSNHLGIGDVEPLGNASSCLLSSPNSDRMIAVKTRCDSQNEVKVYVSRKPKDLLPSPLVSEVLRENQCHEFKEVYLDKIAGRGFLNKMEFLMASLTSASS